MNWLQHGLVWLYTSYKYFVSEMSSASWFPISQLPCLRSGQCLAVGDTTTDKVEIGTIPGALRVEEPVSPTRHFSCSGATTIAPFPKMPYDSTGKYLGCQNWVTSNNNLCLNKNVATCRLVILWKTSLMNAMKYDPVFRMSNNFGYPFHAFSSMVMYAKMH